MPTNLDPQAARRRPRAVWLALLACACLALAGHGWQAASAAEPEVKFVSAEENSGAAARDEAIRSIPFDKLDAAAQTKVRAALSNISVFRRLPTRVVQCDPDLYLFLVRHPDVVVNIWETLRLTQLHVQQIGDDTYQSTEPDGAVCTFQYLYRGHDTHVVLAEGTYAGPVLQRTVKGVCLLVLKTGYVRETDGRYYITNRLDAFLNVEPGAVELVAKTLQPVLGHIAENNFTQTVAFAGSLSRTAEVNSRGVVRLANKLERVQPEDRTRLAEIAERIGQEANTAQVVPAAAPQQAQRATGTATR